MTTNEQRDLVMNAVLDQLFAAADKAGDDPTHIYSISETDPVIECPNDITIRLWTGPRKLYGRHGGIQGIEIFSSSIWGRSTFREVPKLTRVYKFGKMKRDVRPEDNDFAINAEAAHRCVMNRVALLSAKSAQAASQDEVRTQNLSIALATLRAKSIQPREDMVDETIEPIVFAHLPRHKLRGAFGDDGKWDVSISEETSQCSVTVTFDVPTEDVGYVLWKLLRAKHEAAIDLDYNHSPFTVTRQAIDLIPHVIEDRLVIPEALRETIHLKPIARRYAEWLDLAGRAVQHVAEQVLQWEHWIDDENANMRLSVRSARESIAQASVEIRGLAQTLPAAPCEAEALEAQLAPIRLRLARAHDKIVLCLAELSL